MRRKIGVTAFAVAALALASVPAVAVAGKGGNGHGGANGSAQAGGGGGGGNASLTSFAISSQSPGSVTFSLSSSSSPSKAWGVGTKCFDGMSREIWSSYQDVSWDSATIGHAGAFSPPSGRSCYAYVHEDGSDSPLDGGTFSYMAP